MQFSDWRLGHWVDVQLFGNFKLVLGKELSSMIHNS